MAAKVEYSSTYNVTTPRPVTNQPAWAASAQAIEEAEAVVARPLPEASQHVARSSLASDTLSALIASQAQAGATANETAKARLQAATDYDGWTAWDDVWGEIRHQLLERVASF